MSADMKLWDLFKTFSVDPLPAATKAREICGDFLGGVWTHLKQENFEMAIVSGGLSNQMFKCSLRGVTPVGTEPQCALLRIQCEKTNMQLQNEIVMFMELASNDLGPRLLGIFPGGRLEQFIPSRNLTPEELKEPGYQKHCAELMVRVHHLDVPLAKSSQLAATMREWLERIANKGGSEWKLWSKVAKVPEDRFPSKISFAELSNELDRIEEYLNKSTSPIYLAHNDLVYANILVKDGFSIDSEGTRWRIVDGKSIKTDEDVLIIIDFEFGCYNYRGFDVGCFLNEFSSDWGSSPLYTIDLPRMEKKLEHLDYCRIYLEETYKILGTSSHKLNSAGLTGDIEKDIPMLVKEASDFQAIAHYYWGLWNIICFQEGLDDMDFDNGFRDRLAMYFHFKGF